MEIKLSAGDKFQIPENCKATIKDNVIIIEEQNEELKEGSKDGDILHSKTSNIVAIFKYYTSEAKVTFCSYYNTYSTCQLGWDNSYFRHATEEEKQAFFDDLKAKGLRWNAETKTMERIRRRAELDEDYLYIDRGGNVIQEMEGATVYDDKNYNSGNYYLLSERDQAEEDAKAVKAIFEKRLKVK
jgi:hypothetical protein|nr:MAG TPA: hypothetical protein [Bacteriophage sp.]